MLSDGYGRRPRRPDDARLWALFEPVRPVPPNRNPRPTATPPLRSLWPPRTSPRAPRTRSAFETPRNSPSSLTQRPSAQQPCSGRPSAHRSSPPRPPSRPPPSELAQHDAVDHLPDPPYEPWKEGHPDGCLARPSSRASLQASLSTVASHARGLTRELASTAFPSRRASTRSPPACSAAGRLSSRS